MNRLTKLLLTSLTLLVLSACGGGGGSNEPTATTGTVTITGLTPSASLPSTLLIVDEATLVIGVVVDDVLPQTCANLSVDQGNGTYSCSITTSGGQHTLSLIFSIIDVNYGAVQVATAPGVNVNVVPEQTASADFSTAPLTYNDDDGDGISNLDELDEGSNPNALNYYVGGTVSGLFGSVAVIQLNEGSDLSLSGDGSFNFIPAVADNSTYTVTILAQPDSQNQTCTVSNESGTVSGANVSNVTVTCTIDQEPPSIVSTFDDPIIDVSTSFTLKFDETMQPQSLVFSGDLGDEAIASWSQDMVADDTLTILAKVEWPIGTGQRLIIDANDLAGNSLASLTLVFDVSVIHVSTDGVNANDSNVGTRDQPLQTIIAAVNLASNTLSKSEIRVALGTYTTFSEAALTS